ncbi:hypothetical protein PVL29_022710 [Vitis rotundifolia]|uniref:Bifunctional inhibitor/plant lipid transfer protein/seed storage helical domain-containing protein n=1 Tax=Vitis rotundifolia TaxID=103349 RepID=A0AA38YWB4_VITRO|nr:hypothetical protein PVL29_022710 [Vitis rotundifolia]
MALITIQSETTDPMCADVSPNIHACADILQSSNLPDDPPTECCNALRRIQETESRIGVQNTCLCAKSCVITHIVAAGASIKTLDADEQDISISLQAKCGVNLGFNISENAQC